MFNLSKHSDWALLVLRLAIGIIFLYAGINKWQMEDANTVMTILKFAEPIGGIALILGVLTQLASAGFIIIMLGAIYAKATGFYQAPFDLLGTFQSWQIDLMLLAGSIALLIMGAGKISVDSKLTK